MDGSIQATASALPSEEVVLHPSRRQPSGPDVLLRALELCVEAGHLDRARLILGGRELAGLMAMGLPEHEARIKSAKSNLAAATIREGENGPGSLIDECHTLSVFIVRSARIRAGVAARRKAVTV